VALSKTRILGLFDGEAGGELRYRDIIHMLNLNESDRRELRRMLTDLVQLDALRLRKGRWYRLGQGKTALVPDTPVDVRKLRKQRFAEIYEEHDLPVRFPTSVIDEAELLPDVVESIPKGYEDLRGIPLVTIDPPDAKDFDDAVAVMPLENKPGFRLIVAIADVSFYVTPGSELDAEAIRRGTSTYVPGGVVPMLPHKLSSGLCSLKPGEDRLVFAAFLDYAPGARLISKRFATAVIRSRASLSYTQAQEILEGRSEMRIETDLAASFTNMKALFEQLLEQRKARGTVDLDIPEAKVWINEAGEIESIEKAQRFAAHRIIEEFMIAANRAVAEYLDEKELPGLFRIHEAPAEEKIAVFADLSRSLGYRFEAESVTGTEINRYLESLKDAPEAGYLNVLLLRSFKQARYSETDTGHFGLALDHYSHFTSPIRRYPDLEIHRLLKKALAGYKRKKDIDLAHARNAQVAEDCSRNEQRAVSVERKALSLCQAEYMERFVGDAFEGHINGVTNFGFFVQIESPYVEGMVHVSKLPDYFQFDEDAHALVGERSGRRFRLGDKVDVRLIGVDVPKGWVDFDIVLGEEEEEYGRRRRSGRSSRPSSRPGTRPQSRGGAQKKSGSSTRKRSTTKSGPKTGSRKAAKKGVKKGR
jgi:ribonuclease R